MDTALPWLQANVAFPDWHHAEDTAATRIAPLLDVGAPANTWWFIRKRPCWRIRCQPASPAAQAGLERHLDQLAAAGHIAGWTRVVYEPETHAFGGPGAMAAAHRLFHLDSQALLPLVHAQPGSSLRREVSLMLCTAMMRAARLDWCEQGDVWARVAALREPSPGCAFAAQCGLPVAVRRFLAADVECQAGNPAPAVCGYVPWAAAWSSAGCELADLAAAGKLHRGLRDVIAHHVIFAWNRLGLPYETQAVLAATAKRVILGLDPTLAEAR
jgi:thiopeptide-type bacteriocin biosynthesis protein